ncbi:MAG: hypothetical protein ABSE73_19165, partial [Planctomycetota bacterium]
VSKCTAGVPPARGRLAERRDEGGRDARGTLWATHLLTCTRSLRAYGNANAGQSRVWGDTGKQTRLYLTILMQRPVPEFPVPAGAALPGPASSACSLPFW